MSLWNPMAVLANVELNEPIEAQLAAFAPASDARVQDVNTAHPVHATFLDRFTDAFGNKCHPTVLIVRPSAPERIRSADALASIRDVLSASVIPRARARYTRQLGNCGVFYSSSFEFYPWMVDRNLPIRLTPMTATYRVPPLSRVKLGIGWSRGVARDAEQ